MEGTNTGITVIIIILVVDLMGMGMGIIKGNQILVGTGSNLIIPHRTIWQISTICHYLTTITLKLKNSKNSTYFKSTKTSPSQRLLEILRVKGHADRFFKMMKMTTSHNRFRQSSRIYDSLS